MECRIPRLFEFFVVAVVVAICLFVGGGRPSSYMCERRAIKLMNCFHIFSKNFVVFLPFKSSCVCVRESAVKVP